MHIREAMADEMLRWDALVERFDNCRVTHTLAWLRSLEARGAGRPLCLVFEQDGRIVGCLPGMLQRRGPLRLFGSPPPGSQTVSMGPVFDPESVDVPTMMTALLPYLQEQCRVDHIELLTHDLDPRAMAEFGFEGEPVETYRAVLTPEEPQRTFNAMKDNARRNIRRAERLGLVVRDETDEAFVDEAYDQIEEVFLRGGDTVSFGRQRVRRFFRHMKDAGRLVALGVYLPEGDVCIASGLFTVGPRELLLWQWAHRTEHRWYRGTEAMTWTAMQRAMAAGCTSFDLMGGGEFKAKFGAAADLSKVRWTRSRYRWLALGRRFAVRCYRMQQATRGRLTRLRAAK